MKKFLSLVLACMLTLTVGFTSTGCNKSTGVKIDKTKTQLYISNNNQGVGQSYIKAIGQAFEEDFKDYVFEPGTEKKGVQVIYNHNTAISTDNFYLSMESDSDYIYFTENVDYFKFSNKFAKINDVMSEGAITGYTVDEGTGEQILTRESVAVKDKVDASLLGYLNRGTEEAPNYRALPHYLANKALNYSIDIWNENRLYFAKGVGSPSEKWIMPAIVANSDTDSTNDVNMQTAINSYNAEIASGTFEYRFVDGEGIYHYELNGAEQTAPIGKSAGPDGKYGTPDDGLPATYDEFFYLMDVISSASKNLVPIIWSGANPGYADMLTTALWQNYMGADQLNAYYSLNGTVSDLIKLDANGKVVFESDGKTPVIDTPITFDGGFSKGKEGYEIQRTAGKYYALQFVEKIATTSKWTSSSCYLTSATQTATQNTYINNGRIDKKAQQIAMLIDGAWWQQEANSSFRTAEILSKGKYTKDNMKFGVMSLPNATIQRYVDRAASMNDADVKNDIKDVVVAANDSFCFINNRYAEDSVEMKISKIFLSYFNNQKSLNLFAEKTNMLRALSGVTYDTSKMSPFGKNQVEYVLNADVVYPYSNNEVMNNNRSLFENSIDGWNWQSETANGEKDQPLTTIRNSRIATNQVPVSGKDYFEGLYKFYKNEWSKF